MTIPAAAVAGVPVVDAGVATTGLTTTEVTALWFKTLVDGVRGTARMAGMLEAVQAMQLTELTRTRRAEAVVEAEDAVAEGRTFWSSAEAVERAIVDEVAAALRVSTVVAGQRIAAAESLAARPTTMQALAEGHIHAAAAYAIAEGVGLLDGDAAAIAEGRVLARAGQQTPGQVTREVRRAVIAADPAAADRAYRRATQARSARCRAEEAGMASIWVSGTADRVARAWQTATAVAEDRRDRARTTATAPNATADASTPGIPTLDQARADAMLDLLSSPDGLPHASHPGDYAHGQADPTTSAASTPAAINTPAVTSTTPAPTTPASAHSCGHCGSTAGLPVGTGAGREGAAPAVRGLPPGSERVALDVTGTASHVECSGAPSVLPPMDVAVHLVLPIEALSAEPAELEGHGPVPAAFVADLIGAETCRCRGVDQGSGASQAAGNRVRFTRWLVDGAGVVAGTSQRVFSTYRPPRSLDATIRARDLTCRFPGCRTMARACDIDHGISYPTGETAASNLACLCRRHHRLKTHTRWKVTHRPGAVLEWTSPTGHTYLTYPPSWVFGASTQPAPPPPAFSPPHEAPVTPPTWMFGRPGSTVPPHPQAGATPPPDQAPDTTPPPARFAVSDPPAN